MTTFARSNNVAWPDLVDAKGRTLGVLVRVWILNDRMVKDNTTWRRVESDPYVTVNVHPTRDGKQFGVGTPEVEVGLASDPAIESKVQAEITRRTTSTRARYLAKMAKGKPL